jgi:DNA-binding transcriptional ArsR family regulator
LSLTFGALADPTRRATLQRLAAGTANVKELSRPFDMSGPTVCKHLRVLERAGLIDAVAKRSRGHASSTPRRSSRSSSGRKRISVLGRELRPPRRVLA